MTGVDQAWVETAMTNEERRRVSFADGESNVLDGFSIATGACAGRISEDRLGNRRMAEDAVLAGMAHDFGLAEAAGLTDALPELEVVCRPDGEEGA